MESLTKEVEAIAKSDEAFNDNRDILNALLKDASSILHLQLEKTKFANHKLKKSTSKQIKSKEDLSIDGFPTHY